MLTSKTKKYPKPYSLGDKIKKLREYRGLTQKELGVLCGFSETTAHARIQQYEYNDKTPRRDILESLAAALSVDVHSLFDTYLITDTELMHTLFALEDLHGLRPVKVNGHIYLDFSGKTILGTEAFYPSYHDFLEKWYSLKEKNLVSFRDTKEEALQKRKEYDLWRYEYPLNEAKEFSKTMKLLQTKQRLEAELEKINQELNSTEE